MIYLVTNSDQETFVEIIICYNNVLIMIPLLRDTYPYLAYKPYDVYNDKKVLSTNEKVWSHAWIIFHMIIVIIFCDLV